MSTRAPPPIPSKPSFAAAAASDSGTALAFHYPPFWSFPPFFTAQPVDATLSKQRALWSDLIRSYAVHHRLMRLSLHQYTGGHRVGGATASSGSSSSAAASGSERDGQLVNALFRNDAIDRSLTPDFIRSLLDSLAADGWGVWEDPASSPARASFLLSPSHRLPELADAILAHVDSIGEGGGVLTLYELSQGDTMRQALFFGMDPLVLLQALRVLEARGKCVIMHAPILNETGVKFLGS